MRGFVTSGLFVLCASSVQAQENAGVAAEAPVAVQSRAAYASPPASIQLPASWDIESIRAVRGNVARWRDEERARLGPYESSWRGERQVVRNALPAIGGYFAFLGNERFPSGVVEARWDRPGANVGQAGDLAATYTTGRSVCGGAFDRMSVDIGELTFLGPEWRPGFDALDVELAALAPVPAGRWLPEGVLVPHAQPLSWTDFARFYPRRAQRLDQEGLADLGCLVREDLGLVCGVITESPEGFDFGASALRIFQWWRVAPLATQATASRRVSASAGA